MIKTIDKAVEVLNAKQYRGYAMWSVKVHNQEQAVSGPTLVARPWGTDTYVEFTPPEAIAIARSLNGDYEALEAENTSLSSKLERVREAAGAVDREFKWMLTNSLQYRSVFGSTLEALSTALAETEEEKADSESTACGRIGE